MAVIKATLILSLVALALTPTVTGNILDDFTKGVNNVLDSVNGIVCVAQHKSEFDECYNKVRGVYSDLQNQDNQKVSEKFVFG